MLNAKNKLKDKMANDFQIWLMSQGYYRKEGSLIWWKDNEIVKGADLFKKLREWKSIKHHD